MRLRNSITARKVSTAEDREAALGIIDAVYRREKRWIANPAAEIPEDPTAESERSWFVAFSGRRAVGVIRLVYDPPLELPAELGVKLDPGVDLQALAKTGRFVDIGRFMIRPRYRRNLRIAMSLMRTGTIEVVARGYTHLLTDVFADDPHSPLRFHTRVLGFERIGTHETGELTCASSRVILVLDLARAYQRAKLRQDRIWKDLGEGVRDLMESRRLVPQS
jgi:hypothetical protein